MISSAKYCFGVLKPVEDNIVYRSVRSEPFKIYGLYNGSPENFYRLPSAFAETVNKDVAARMRESAGLRVRFATDSPFIAINAQLEDFSSAPHLTTLASKGFDLYVEKDGIFTYHNSFHPPFDTENEIAGITYFGESKIRNIVIDFPLGAVVRDLRIGFRKGSGLFPGHGYKLDLPIVFYGSSVTQGFSASRPGNTYQNFISRALNADYINMGFSSGALGEKNMAEYLSRIPMSVFVLDFDRDPPDAELLKRRHAEFYRIIRGKNPTLPIVILSRPATSETQEERLRRKIIVETYCNGILDGDKNLYYIDGCSFFRKDALFDCTVDGCLPNDLGMYFIAKKIIKTLNSTDLFH